VSDVDIATRLRDTAYETDVCWEAANEIERLRRGAVLAAKNLASSEIENEELASDVTRLLEELGQERALADDLHAVLSRLQPDGPGADAQRRYREARRV